LINFNIRGYSDNILCDVVTIDVCSILLETPWQFDRRVMHDGRINPYYFEKDGKKLTYIL
jgi:hypothetical protein